MFLLTDDESTRPGKKLRAFSGSSRAGKHILKIEVEYSSASDMGYDLDQLQTITDAKTNRTRKKNQHPTGAGL